MTFSEKIIREREKKNWSQQKLATKVGLSRRMICKYEYSGVRPHPKTLRRLASVLGVSADYLSHHYITDPSQTLETIPLVQTVKAKYGSKSAQKVSDLLQRNATIFAGDDFSEDTIDDLFQAITTVYLESKNSHKRKFGRKRSSVHFDEIG